jgi:hypothetical protein
VTEVLPESGHATQSVGRRLRLDEAEMYDVPGGVGGERELRTECNHTYSSKAQRK